MSDNPRARITSYSAALATFGLASGAALFAARRAERPTPDRYQPADLVLGTFATQKFARMLAKDPVTTPLRAPFTDYEGVAGDAELNESPKSGPEGGHGRHTLGELLSCPFCLAPWVAGGYVACLAFAPRVARSWAAVFALVSVSDALQHVYARLQAD